ncbi:NEDD8 protease nep2 [Homalodisca vitripennis]|nr:NEDD8 protease nep2 [Homalodisca vitripennis]
MQARVPFPCRGVSAEIGSIVIANYMMWKAANAMVDRLTSEMIDRKIKYNMYAMSSRTPQRWISCMEHVSSSMLSVALSALYVKRYFNETTKNTALNMTKMILQEMSREIQELDWIEEGTRKRVEYKLSHMNQFIGYPDEFGDISNIEEFYNGLKINTNQFFEALEDLIRWSNNYNTHQLRNEVNRTDWKSHGEIIKVNAFYGQHDNSIYIPAGILQQPFITTHVPQYVNYARIGLIIGHEITHGFDDQGIQFDFQGNFNDWWDKQSKENFMKKNQCIINQHYSFGVSQT